MIGCWSLLLRDERPLVFVVRQGRAAWVYVDKGVENDDWVEIIDGVEAGDEIITAGHFSLAHDTPVRIAR